MFAATSPFEQPPTSPCATLPRVVGGVAVSVDARDQITRVASISERDGYKVRFPRRADPPEAIIINTGGGLAGGDQVTLDFTIGDDASLVATTQAAERSYRSLNSATATVDMTASIGERANFKWLPQETILFDQSRLARCITVDMPASASALLAETVIFGRRAHGETLRQGLFIDSWRVRRDGRLIFAENTRLDAQRYARLDDPVIARGALAALTVALIAPDAEDRITAARGAIEGTLFDCAASAWDGKLIVRALVHRNEEIRHLMSRLIPALGAGPLPRVWWT